MNTRSNRHKLIRIRYFGRRFHSVGVRTSHVFFANRKAVVCKAGLPALVGKHSRRKPLPCSGKMLTGSRERRKVASQGATGLMPGRISHSSAQNSTKSRSCSAKSTSPIHHRFSPRRNLPQPLHRKNGTIGFSGRPVRHADRCIRCGFTRSAGAIGGSVTAAGKPSSRPRARKRPGNRGGCTSRFLGIGCEGRWVHAAVPGALIPAARRARCWR